MASFNAHLKALIGGNQVIFTMLIYMRVLCVVRVWRVGACVHMHL